MHAESVGAQHSWKDCGVGTFFHLLDYLDYPFQLHLPFLWQNDHPFSCGIIQWSEINLKRWIEPLSVKETLNNNLEWPLSDIFVQMSSMFQNILFHQGKNCRFSIRKVEPPKQAYRCIKNYLLYLKEKISRSNSCRFPNICCSSLPVFPIIWFTYRKRARR